MAALVLPVSILALLPSLACDWASAYCIRIRRQMTEFRRHFDLRRWRQRRRKSTSGFSFGEVSVVIGMRFSVGIPNVIPIGPWATELYYDVLAIFKMAAVASKSTSGFRFDDVLQLGTSKSICILNFDNVALSAADILLFLVSKSKFPPYCDTTSGFHFDVFDVIGM